MPQHPYLPETECVLDMLALQALLSLPTQLQSPGQARKLTQKQATFQIYKHTKTQKTWVQIQTLPLPAKAELTFELPATLRNNGPPNRPLLRQPWAVVPTHQRLFRLTQPAGRRGRAGRWGQ